MAGKGATAREEFAALRTIGEVAEHLDLPQHVLRFWETRFKEIDPVKRAGGRRFYRPRDIALVEAIRHLLYREGYTIKGVQRILKEQGVDAVIADVQRRQSGESSPPAPTPPAETPPPEPAAEPTLFDMEPKLPDEPHGAPPPAVAHPDAETTDSPGAPNTHWSPFRRLFSTLRSWSNDDRTRGKPNCCGMFWPKSTSASAFSQLPDVRPLPEGRRISIRAASRSVAQPG
ncbi:MerR family transcriptional regulator [Methylocystis sp. IM2]|uniref:MerR family transcriptional regulator n=1 Tax=Methylocystis sp. IM2 TaxID=3136563 RepID=UPI0030F6CCB9